MPKKVKKPENVSSCYSMASNFFFRCSLKPQDRNSTLKYKISRFACSHSTALGSLTFFHNSLPSMLKNLFLLLFFSSIAACSAIKTRSQSRLFKTERERSVVLVGKKNRSRNVKVTNTKNEL